MLSGTYYAQNYYASKIGWYLYITALYVVTEFVSNGIITEFVIQVCIPHMRIVTVLP